MPKSLNEQVEEFAHQLKLKFRLPRDRPTDEELVTILVEATKATDAKRASLTADEWGDIVYATVKFTGKYIYEGLDFSDLNTLFVQIRQQAAARRR